MSSCYRCEGAGKLLTSALRLAERMQLIYSQFQDDTLVGKVNDIECHLVALLETHVTKYVYDPSLLLRCSVKLKCGIPHVLSANVIIVECSCYARHPGISTIII